VAGGGRLHVCTLAKGCLGGVRCQGGQKNSTQTTTSNRAKSTRKPEKKKAAKVATPAPATRAPPDEIISEAVFPVVGIGGSAGGLETLKKLFSTMSKDTGIAFVVVSRLDPTHESLVVELLAKQTDLPVCEAEVGTAIGPNCLYVIPPNKYLAIMGRLLHLPKPPQPPGSRLTLTPFYARCPKMCVRQALGLFSAAVVRMVRWEFRRLRAMVG